MNKFFFSLIKQDKNKIKIIFTLQGGELDSNLKSVCEYIEMNFAPYPWDKEKWLFFREYSLYNNNKKEYVLSPYDLISNEVDSLFLLLPENFTLNENIIFCNNLSNYYKKNNNNYAATQLWTSIIRAKFNLVIYTKNEETLKYCQKIEEIFLKFKNEVI